jgi:hypothetical protein
MALLIALSFFAVSCALTPTDSDDNLLTTGGIELAFQSPPETSHVSDLAVQTILQERAAPATTDRRASVQPLDIELSEDQFLLGSIEGRAPPSNIPA